VDTHRGGPSPPVLLPAMTIAEAAAPPITMTLVPWALAGGALVLFPSLAYLFRIFKRMPDRDDPARADVTGTHARR
jgi:cytochrome bd-type quinol oxidase subunit 2